jgi:hypothetical protein
VGPIVNGQAEIAGMPKDLLAMFSKRAATIEGAMAVKLDSLRHREAGNRHRRSVPPWSVKPRPIPVVASPGSVSPIGNSPFDVLDEGFAPYSVSPPARATTTHDAGPP